jgi:hypothetical protein
MLSPFHEKYFCAAQKKKYECNYPAFDRQHFGGWFVSRGIFMGR